MLLFVVIFAKQNDLIRARFSKTSDGLKMNYLKAVFSIIILFLFVVNYADEPELPPYFSYHVSGIIECDTLADISNYSIALFGKQNKNQPEFRILNGLYKGNERPISLTDSDGKYNIIVNDENFFDSLKVGCIRPHQPTIFSESYAVEQYKLIEVSEAYQKNSSGCSSCSAEPTLFKIICYEYHEFDTKLILCN